MSTLEYITCLAAILAVGFVLCVVYNFSVVLRRYRKWEADSIQWRESIREGDTAIVKSVRGTYLVRIEQVVDGQNEVKAYHGQGYSQYYPTRILWKYEPWVRVDSFFSLL